MEIIGLIPNPFETQYFFPGIISGSQTDLGLAIFILPGGGLYPLITLISCSPSARKRIR